MSQPPAPPEAVELPTCANCAAPLQGAWCHRCGQHAGETLKPFASMLADAGEAVFNVDSRIFRSLVPLQFRPGFLTLEYFAGRRARYVSPFRLFLFLCLAAFLALRFSLPADAVRGHLELDAPAAGAELAPPSPAGDGPAADGGGRLLEPHAVAWLPAFANRYFDQLAGRVDVNLRVAAGEPGKFLAGTLGLLPQALFVLVPVFALLLKLAFISRRRLYVEHLIVALHSHAFIFQTLLLLALLALLQRLSGTLATSRFWDFAGTALWAWIPAYLFLMQKKIYRQGWAGALLAFLLIGSGYLVLLGLAIGAGALAWLAFE